jgi:CBS domain-containing protein
MREYAVDPLEALFVRDVMSTNVLTLPASRPASELGPILVEPSQRRQRLYPVLDADGDLVGVLGRSEIERSVGAHRADGVRGADGLRAADGAARSDGADAATPPHAAHTAEGTALADAPASNDDVAPSDHVASETDEPTVADLMRPDMTLAYDDETLRTAADRMAAAHVRMLPVVDRDEPTRMVGLISQFDLLRARDRLLTEERHRERVLRVRLAPPTSGWTMSGRRRSGGMEMSTTPQETACGNAEPTAPAAATTEKPPRGP